MAKKLGIIAFVAVIATYLPLASAKAAENFSADEIAMYTAADVKVDVVDKDAASARKHAINNGQSLGLFKVLERIVDPKQFESMPEISDDEIADMVQDIAVSGEKTSRVRYMASLDIHFKPSVIRKFLTENNISFVQKPSAPYLLLPIYYESNNVFLWESPNSWVGAWKKAHPALIPLILPKEDENEIVKIKLKDIQSANAEAFKNWQNIYGVAGVIVAEVRNAKNRLKMKAIKYRNGEPIDTVNLSTSYKKDLPSALDNLAESYISKTENAWRDANLINIADDTFITVIIPTSGISDWLYINKQLKQIATVTKIELKATTKNKAQIELWFADGVNNLSKSLRKKGLALKKIDDDVYELRAFAADENRESVNE